MIQSYQRTFAHLTSEIMGFVCRTLKKIVRLRPCCESRDIANVNCTTIESGLESHAQNGLHAETSEEYCAKATSEIELQEGDDPVARRHLTRRQESTSEADGCPALSPGKWVPVPRVQLKVKRFGCSRLLAEWAA